MSLQQNVGLYPFVYDIITVDPMFYPDICTTSITSQSAPSFLLSDEYNIYGTLTHTVDNSVVLNIVRYQKQDYHQNYFTCTPALNYHTQTPLDICASYPYNFGEQLQLDTNNNIYLMYNLYRDIPHLYLNKYSIIGGNCDLSLSWSVDILDSTPFPPINTTYSRTQCGFMIETQGGSSVYCYRLDVSAVTVVKCGKTDGTILGSGQTTVPYTVNDITMLLAPNPIVNNIQITGFQNSAYLISTTNNPAAQYVNLSEVTSNPYTAPTAIQSLYNVPCQLAAVAYNDMLATIMVFNGNRGLNSLAVDDVRLDASVGALCVPATNIIDKLTFFNEIFSSTQRNAYVTLCTNPLNPNFVYVAYVTSTSNIRVIKFYRNNTSNTSIPSYSYLVMWATNVHAFGDYTVGSVGSTINMATDRLGVLYLMAYNVGTTLCRIWKISEFYMDLGHTQGTLSAEANTIPNMLVEIDNLYTIAAPLLPLQMSLCPYINASTGAPLGTIITDVTPTGDGMKVKLSYINYDMFQLDASLTSGLQNAIGNGFNSLYQQSPLINILDNSLNRMIINGNDNYIVATVSLLTSNQPCISQGTEIVKYEPSTRLAVLVKVETLHVGDYVVNQHGRPVQILDHTASTIYTDQNNSPYIVPANYFSMQRPYKQLYISGDHGILMDYRRHKMVYPYKLPLRRLPLGIFVEYHHLRLFNDESNCFIANGLEVDSLHLVPYL